MSSYKRNQIEEAISGVLEPRSTKPTTELLTRLKRLLDTDRSLGRIPRSTDPERTNYAFYSAEPPGSGIEVQFSDYEAFALLIGLQMMGHGWPQSFAVSLMRRVKPELEKEHSRILKQDATKLFDQAAIRRNAKAGDLAFDVTDPILLTIVTRFGAAQEEEASSNAFAICRGPNEAMRSSFGMRAEVPAAQPCLNLQALRIGSHSRYRAPSQVAEAVANALGPDARSARVRPTLSAAIRHFDLSGDD